MTNFKRYNKEEAKENKEITLYYRYNKELDRGFLWIENGTNDIKFKFSSADIKTDAYQRYLIELVDERYSLTITTYLFYGDCMLRDKKNKKNNVSFYLNSLPQELFHIKDSHHAHAHPPRRQPQKVHELALE